MSTLLRSCACRRAPAFALIALLLGGAGATRSSSRGVTSPQRRTQTPALFRSKEGYSLRPPTGLRRNRAENSLVPLDVLFGRIGATCFSVVALPRNTRRNRSLEQIRAANIQFMSRAMDGFKLRAQGRTTIDGVPAVTLTSTFKGGPPPVPLQTLNVFVIRGDMLYTFGGVCPVGQVARYAPIFQKTLASVRWTKK